MEGDWVGGLPAFEAIGGDSDLEILKLVLAISSLNTNIMSSSERHSSIGHRPGALEASTGAGVSYRVSACRGRSCDAYETDG